MVFFRLSQVLNLYYFRIRSPPGPRNGYRICCCCRRKEGCRLVISGSLLVECPDVQRVLSPTMIVNAQTTPEMLLLLSRIVSPVRECLYSRALNPSQEASGLGDPSRRPGTSIGCNGLTPKAEEEADRWPREAGKVNRHPQRHPTQHMCPHRFGTIPPGSRMSDGVSNELYLSFIGGTPEDRSRHRARSTSTRFWRKVATLAPDPAQVSTSLWDDSSRISHG